MKNDKYAQRKKIDIFRQSPSQAMAEQHSPTSIVHTRLQSTGRPLDHATRSAMEPHFGHSFADVQVHTDQQAADSAEALGARAFTLGNTLVFGAGQYAPETSEGQRLLAHELTHVVQQRGAAPIHPGVSQRGEAAEVEARATAEQVVAGNAVQVQSTPGAAVARDEDDDKPVDLGDVDSWPENQPPVDLGDVDKWPENQPPVDLGDVDKWPESQKPIDLGDVDSWPESKQGAKPEEGGLMQSAWNFISNNALSGGASLLSEGAKSVAPIFGSAGAGRALNAAGKLPGVGPLNAVLGPIGMVSGAISVNNDLEKLDKGVSSNNVSSVGDLVADSLGLGSAAITTAQLGGAGLTALGAEGAGASVAGAIGGGTLIGSAGAVAGAGAAGWAAGRLLDEGVDWVGDKITGNEKADHSISAGIGSGLNAIDSAIHGVSDDPANNPNENYRKTWGYRLAQWLDD